MIVLRDVCKTYEKNAVSALRHVNLDVAQGQYLSIVGPSGSGKSTLMHILGCMDTPTSGQYFLGGDAVCAMDGDALARLRNLQIGFVFQAFRLSPDLSALENVALPLLFRGVPKRERLQRAAQALTRVGLQDRMQHRPSMLSGGQQQRVAIARAVCTEPSVLLADEPTGNLDPAAAQEVLALFDALHDAGNTIILITHDRTVAARAQRCAMIAQGELTAL